MSNVIGFVSKSKNRLYVTLIGFASKCNLFFLRCYY